MELAIGLSLGVLFGILMDNIGTGMMFGAATGLCSGNIVSFLKCKKRINKKK